ncbi:MAG: threonine--tRNA ligase [Acidimicrobiia bacterium]|nr:threonine--tRNA ligase [Acidimicrobiia bacterium]MDH4363908.1 threonine--tRNA ligase [Acidimicrobiia bacterium]
MSDISIALPDGSQRRLPAGSTAADLATSIGRRLAADALVAVVDGKPVDLNRPLADGQTVQIVTPDSELGLDTLRHSTSHVLAQAVLSLWPGATFAIGPAIADGFYYDFSLPDGATFSEDDLERIEARMREIVKDDQPFVRSELAPDDARTLMAEHPYKREIIDRVTSGDASGMEAEALGGNTVSFYRNTDAFVDMCVGPHVPSTGRLGHFKLMKVAGAYWRGDEHQPMLQRIYGTAWATKEQLAEHLKRLEEAAQRDHRKLANELDLLSFPSELGGGLAVWHPRGAIVRKVMEDYSRARHQAAGYQFAYTPHLARAQLFETSGHLSFYADGMYPPMEMDNGVYYPKPMNCPMHVLIYRSRQRSYRELPLRLFELGTVYRYERAGTLHGLMRARGFTQDDSHIFVPLEGLADEIRNLLDFVIDMLRSFGFDEFQAKLSTQPPEKSIGTDEMWELSTKALAGALDAHGLDYTIDEGGGAFYGPKIDVDVRDAIGRAWQLSTIQVDFNHPERFGLEYVAPDGERRPPVMVHRALMGSLDRFFGVLLEHYAGNLPLWLAPVQVEILPVAADHEDYAWNVRDRLIAAGLRVEVTGAGDPLGRRIRNAKMQKVPYVLVVGDNDVAAGTVGVNPRGGGDVERDVPLGAFEARLAVEAVPGTVTPAPAGQA